MEVQNNQKGWEHDWEFELGSGDKNDVASSSVPLLKNHGQHQPFDPTADPSVAQREYEYAGARAPSQRSQHHYHLGHKSLTSHTSRLLKIFTALVISVVIFCFLPWHWKLTATSRTPSLFGQEGSENGNGIVGTNSKCRIADIPLRSEAYVATTKKMNVTISQCGDSSKFTEFINSTTLTLLNPNVYDRRKCTVYEIDRPLVLLDDTFVLKSTKAFDETNKIQSIETEHVIISCDVGSETKMEYQSDVSFNKINLQSKQAFWDAVPKTELPLNVMVLVLDSTSAADAFRNLPRTMKFLMEDLKFTYFSKHHALGEPTFLNAIPLLVGVPTKTLFDEKKWIDYWDDTEFIWKYFHRSNFATAFMEDDPIIGTFNYDIQKGFTRQPTDFYPRPLFTAWEALVGNTEDRCLGNTPFWKYLFDYELKILRKLNNLIPSFTMPWLCWPFHDYFNTLGTIENATLEFFQSIADSKDLLENTVIFVMGDHGFYQGGYAKSNAGLIERRLPLLLMRIPQRLTKFIPEVESIIDQNSKQVVSHYDVFQTLLALSQLGRKETNQDEIAKLKMKTSKFGRNLLQLLPDNRSCDDAGIPKQWCACNLPVTPPYSGFWELFSNPLKLYTEPYVDRSRV